MIQSNINRIEAEGNGSGSVFSLSPMVLLEDDDLSVVTVDTDGVETTRTEGTGATNYSLSVSSYPGTGSITYPASGSDYLEAGEYIVVTRATPITQENRLENQGGYFPAVQESMFDRLTVICQNLQEQIDRCLKITVGEVGESPEEIYDDLQTAAAEAEAAASAAAASAAEAATFSPALYIAAAGDSMVGDLNIDNEDAENARKLIFVHENDTETELYRGTGGGDWFIDHTTASGTTASIVLNPFPGSASGTAHVSLFKDTDTTGNKRLRFHKGDGTTNTAADISVNADLDGLDVTGKFAVAGEYDEPFIIDTIRLWENDGVLMWKDGSDPSSISDGDRVSPFSRQFVSSDLTISSTTEAFTQAHGFGAQPTFVQAALVCQSAEEGYSVGDVIHMSQGTTVPGTSGGFTVSSDTTNIVVSMKTMSINHKSTGAVDQITPANWKLRIYAWR